MGDVSMTEDFDLPFPQYRCPSCERDLPLNEARMTVTCSLHRHDEDLAFAVRQAQQADRKAIEEICDRALGETEIDVFGKTFEVTDGINMIAEVDGALAGLLSLALDGGDLVVVLLSVYPEYQGRGLGSGLVKAAAAYAREHSIPFLRAAVSNDDVPQLYFYQRHGFVIYDIAVGLLVDTTGSAVAGFSGIPSRDEIRLRLPVCA